MYPNAICMAALLGLLSPIAAQAVTLDWDSLSWTPGFSNSFEIDSTNPGNDVTVTVSGDTGRLQPDTVTPFAPTPSLATSLDGGLVPAENTLLLFLNVANQNEAVMLSVSFSAYAMGVSGVSFTIFDVDFVDSVFQDQLRVISALSIDGFTLIAPTITTSIANTLSGTGLSQVVDGIVSSNNTGAGSSDGNVTISFGSNVISSFSFVYGSGSTAPVDPGNQKIGIHDISFTPVPEMNPAWIALLSCMAAAGLTLRHRVSLRK